MFSSPWLNYSEYNIKYKLGSQCKCGQLSCKFFTLTISNGRAWNNDQSSAISMILAFPSTCVTIQFEWEANAEIDPVLKGS